MEKKISTEAPSYYFQIFFKNELITKYGVRQKDTKIGKKSWRLLLVIESGGADNLHDHSDILIKFQ